MKNKITKYSLNQKGFHYAKNEKILYYMKGSVKLWSEESLDKLKKITS